MKTVTRHDHITAAVINESVIAQVTEMNMKVNFHPTNWTTRTDNMNMKLKLILFTFIFVAISLIVHEYKVQMIK